ncbi:reverse transcriptase [Phytophthora megakarya]|uniref:Reverse transcriptase n=1 Tax=Phytophthora megakarya TaxID=4795 RepID=A0A225W3W0_9STRA|nr:reverse transcriptase [Phytophthora megakarya]
MIVASYIIAKWKGGVHGIRLTAARDKTRVGFFDGGSRGNPGPGGSGSIVVEVGDGVHSLKMLWAAATALGRKTTTNNIAEFVGLHRLLTKAVEQNWTGIHVVGDSALILRMMETRKPPRARKLQHWYRVARRLADLCAVQSWRHHYRRHNKMADWAANFAMNTHSSVTMAFEDSPDDNEFTIGVKQLMHADVTDWISRLH